jgi:putative transposase
MARKPRIHYPGAFYHVILRGNGGQEIFYSKADRSRFYLLLQEGIERYGHRFHAFCLMTNHLHLVVQVGDMPLAKILQNISFRYTRYINKKKKRNGHLFQGRYKAILIDADSYLLELVRYIHNNPLRTGLVNKPEQYQWSSHRAYLDKETVTWLTTDFVLSQFAKNEKKARQQFQAFCLKGGNEERREEFHQGTFDGRILGDDGFSENVLAMAKERFHAPVSVEQLVKVVCKVYRMNEQAIVVPGKHQPGAEARAVVAYFAQEAGKPSLTELGKYFQRDPTAMSRAAGRLRERLANDRALTARLKKVKSSLK